MGCFPPFTTQQLFSPPPFPPLPLTYFPVILPIYTLPLTQSFGKHETASWIKSQVKEFPLCNKSGQGPTKCFKDNV